MSETQEKSKDFWNYFADENAAQQFPELMAGVMRAYKQEVLHGDPDMTENEKALRYSERAAMISLCLCCRMYDAECVRTSQVGEAMDLAPSTITPLLDALERKGFLTRRRMESDRRVVLVSPTQSGWDTAERYRERNIRQFSRMLSWLGEEDSVQLLRILKRIAEYYGEDH